MLIIPVKEGENIDRALKRFKRKFLQTQVLKEIRQRKEFTKKSEKLRVKKQKAAYSENLLRNSQQQYPKPFLKIIFVLFENNANRRIPYLYKI